MKNNVIRPRSRRIPIESHVSAAWANIERLEPNSQVPIPSELEVENAKEWVETNQK